MRRNPKACLKFLSLLVIFNAIILCIGNYVWSGVSLASSTPAFTSASTAISNFQGCWSTSRQPTDVLILVDTTASLKSTDPMALRVVGLESALRAMSLANAASPGVLFKVRMIGFSQNLEFFNGTGFSGWTAVTNRNLASLYKSAQYFEGREDGDFTNFANALAGSEAILGPQTANCKALLWFTDGANDESNNGQTIPLETAEHENTSRICEPGGVADNFVSDDIYSFAVGLTNQTGKDGQEELQSIVEGASPLGPDPVFPGICGKNGASDSVSTATGHFFNSPTASQLVLNMQQVFTPINEGGVGPSAGGLCPAQGDCPSANLSNFWIGPGIRDFFIDTEALGSSVTGIDTRASELVITDLATHQEVRITRGSSGTVCYDPTPQTGNCSLGGVTIEPSSIDDGELAVAGIVPADLPPAGEMFRYAILSANNTGSVQYLFYETPSIVMKVTPTFSHVSKNCPAEEGKTLVSYINCPTHFSVGLVSSATGKVFKEGSISDVSSDVYSSQVPVSVTTSKSAEPVLNFTFPTTSSPGPQSIQLHAVLHLGPNGFWPLTLGNTTVFTLRTQPGYPSVRIRTISTTIRPGQAISTPVTVSPGIGGLTNGGCFQILRVTVSDLAGLKVTSSLPRRWTNSCVTLQSGHSVKFIVVTKLLRGTNGGPFTVNLRAELGSATTNGQMLTPSFHIPFRVLVPLNVGRSLVLLLLLMLGGLALLFGVAMTVNVVSGRFAPLNVIMYRTYEVTFGDTTPGFGEPGSPNAAKSFQELTSANDVESDGVGTKRSFSIDGLEFRATTGDTLRDRLKGLVNGATATVRDTSGSLLIVGGRFSSSSLVDRPISVPLTLDGTWIFRPTEVMGFDVTTDDPLVSASSGFRTVTGKLTFLVREGAGSSDFRALRQSAESQLSSVIDQFSVMKGLQGVSEVGSATNSNPEGGTGPLFDGL